MITKGDVFKEIISPKDAEKQGVEGASLLLYKAVYMGIRLILDVRHNQVRISKGEKLELKVSPPASRTQFDKTKVVEKKKPDNPVIKDSDIVEVRK